MSGGFNFGSQPSGASGNFVFGAGPSGAPSFGAAPQIPAGINSFLILILKKALYSQGKECQRRCHR